MENLRFYSNNYHHVLQTIEEFKQLSSCATDNLTINSNNYHKALWRTLDLIEIAIARCYEKIINN